MLLLTLRPSTLADGERLERGLRQLTSEDPALTVVAVVPLAQLFGFHVALREHSRGRGTHSLQLDSYQPVDDPDVTGGESDPRVRVPRTPAPRPGDGGIAIPEPD